MWIDYPRQIRESFSQLKAHEQRLRGHFAADRVKMLRLLKSRSYRSRRALVPVLGYCERQLQRWWELYQAGGLTALLAEDQRGGRAEQLSSGAWEALEARMRTGQIARLKEAQAYLKQDWSIPYQVSGLSRLFQRRQVKLKTGRRQHRKASAAQQAAFKKTSGKRWISIKRDEP